MSRAFSHHRTVTRVGFISLSLDKKQSHPRCNMVHSKKQPRSEGSNQDNIANLASPLFCKLTCRVVPWGDRTPFTFHHRKDIPLWFQFHPPALGRRLTFCFYRALNLLAVNLGKREISPVLVPAKTFGGFIEDAVIFAAAFTKSAACARSSAG
jgi:hypothetical protein